MITLFSIPRAFNGHIETIQRNAVTSWTLLEPRPEIILFGGDEGTKETAAEFRLRHVPQVACNDYGTPLLSDLFGKAQELATYDILGYVNADIILMSDFMDAIRRVSRPKRRFLVVGQRWEIEINNPLDFRSGWEEGLRSLVAGKGKLQSQAAMDYFIFPRGMWGEIPPFAIGRTIWDNWLCYRARALSVPVIDATESVMIVHQNHDYAHLPRGKIDAWEGPEAQRNSQLAGGWAHVFTLQDASHKLPPNGRPRLILEQSYVKRHLETIPMLYPYAAQPVRLLRAFIRLSRPARMAVRRYLSSRRSI